MKTTFNITLFFFLGISIVSSNGFAQCVPHEHHIPWFQILGNLLCSDLSSPTDVSLLEFRVDDTACPESDFIFIYPYHSASTYLLEFHVNNTTIHDFSVCVQGLCGTEYLVGGFSIDGITPGECGSEHSFPAGYSVDWANIVIGDSASTPTPLPLSTDTMPLGLTVLLGLSLALLVVIRISEF